MGVCLVLDELGERALATLEAPGEALERAGCPSHAREERVALLARAGELTEEPLAVLHPAQDLLEDTRRLLHVRHRVLQVDERRLPQLAIPDHGPEQSLATLDRAEDVLQRAGHLDDVGDDVAALPEHCLVVDRVDRREEATRRDRRRVG